MKQKTDENVTDFIARVDEKCYRADATCIMDKIIQQGVLKEINTPMFINNYNPQNTTEVIDSAKIGQSVVTFKKTTDPPTNGEYD